jgi:hypothetical protein
LASVCLRRFMISPIRRLCCTPKDRSRQRSQVTRANGAQR